MAVKRTTTIRRISSYSFLYHFEKTKRIFASIETQKNGPVLCVLCMYLAMDGKDKNGLRLEKAEPTLSKLVLPLCV